MSIYDCLQRAVASGELSPIHAAQARHNYTELRRRYEDLYPPHQAAALAKADLKQATQKAKAARLHSVVAQLVSMRRIREEILRAPDMAVAIRNLIEHSEWNGSTSESVRSIQEGLQGQVAAKINEVLEEFKTNVTGKASRAAKAKLENFMDELHGKVTGDARAAELATAVKEAQDFLRRLFNAYGGDIGKLDDYGVPHAHSPELLIKAGFDDWAEKITQRLAWHRIIDTKTGKPFVRTVGKRPRPADVKVFLQDVFDGITTRGWDDRAPSLQMGGKALYNQRAEARVLHFTDGKDWLAYNADFGIGDPFSALLGGLSGLARDVSLLRVLGPNPKAALDYAAQVATKEAQIRAAKPGASKADRKLPNKISASAKLTKTMLDHVNGAANIPESIAMASFFRGVRNFATATKLGSAAISSVTDYGTMRMAAKIVGMNPNSLIAKSVELTASAASRQTAARLGYVADALMDAGSGYSRFMGSVAGPGLTGRLAEFTLRATGLTFLTDMRKTAFKMEFSGYLADNADRAFDQIDASLRGIFEKRGITAQDWEALRDPTVRFTAPNGADFISGSYFVNHQTALSGSEAQGLAMKLNMIIHEQLELAVPTASLEGRARLVGGVAPGNLGGELLRSAMMFKSFGVSLTLGQIRRIAALPTPQSRVAYAAQISGTLLILGGLAIQLKELAKGNDPRPMDEVKFWQAAILQGGGLGIFGDFFSASTNRFGGGFAGTVAGPVVSTVGDVIAPFATALGSKISGEDATIGRDLTNLVRRNTPFLSSAWMARSAFQNGVMDFVQSVLDPDAEKQWKRAQKKQEKDYGTGQWWGRGKLVPQRAPELGNAFGGGS